MGRRFRVYSGWFLKVTDMNLSSPSKRLPSLEQQVYRLYVVAATFIGLVLAATVGDSHFQWSYRTYSDWASPLLWNFWLPCSALFAVVLLIRRRWLLLLSPAGFLVFFLLVLIVGPVSISPETARTGKHQGLEPFDFIFGIFGLCYTVLNLWLLTRRTSSDQGKPDHH